MSGGPELGEVFRLLRKPLEYAAGLDPSRLQIVPDLGKTLEKIVANHPRSADVLRDFSRLARGLDSLQGEARMARVIELVRALDRAETGKPARKAASTRVPRSMFKELDTPVQYVKGVGPRMAEKFERLGIATVEDLLFHLPSRYEDRRDIKKVRELKEGERATILAEVMVAGPVQPRWGQRRFHLMLSDGTGFVTGKWFNYRGDWLDKRFRVGQRVVATGVPRPYELEMEMHHPDVEIVSEGADDDDSELSGVVPVYPLTEGVFQKSLRRIVQGAVDAWVDKLPEALPPEYKENRRLPTLIESLRYVHQPPDDVDFKSLSEFRTSAHRRLSYEELFLLELGLALRRKGLVEEPSVSIGKSGLADKFIASLPFKLTGSQEKVVADIERDIARPNPMHRLLQGDVGSGKTVVALIAALCAIGAGYQAALMAPTEVLAEQHSRTVNNLLGPAGVKYVLLTGAVRGRERSEALEAIESGKTQLVIGTHAVIQEKVGFRRLALGIIDEQHRFGVMQRARLKAKGPEGTTPHLLVMTATPIPRTLAMTLYGDLAVSVIREMPPGRKPVKTKLYKDKEREQVYKLVRKQVGQGRQVFVVYPLVEESETLDLRDAMSMFENFRDEIFPDLRLGLVHGRMKSDEKEAVMKSFQRGDIDVLVATTVIEVGIDVPNASMMVVEHADRFGLSQLHQLRGRVGRGEHESLCALVAGYTRSEDAWKRLKVMERTGDGFKIAEEDLAIRGPGEFFGTRQAGLPDFRVANIIRDAEVLSEAREDAFEMVKKDPDLADNALLLAMLRRRWGRRLRLGSV